MITSIPFPAQLGAQPLRPTYQGEFARDVWKQMRKGDLSSDGGDVYNRSVATREHLRQDRERRMERTEEVDIHRLLEATQGLALRRANKDNSRVVHDYVDLTEVRSRCSYRLAGSLRERLHRRAGPSRPLLR